MKKTSSLVEDKRKDKAQKEFYIYPAVSKHFLVFIMLHLMLDGLILFCKGDFHHIRRSKLVFKRRNFGGTHHFWRFLLNSTTVLFDKYIKKCGIFN